MGACRLRWRLGGRAEAGYETLAEVPSVGVTALLGVCPPGRRLGTVFCHSSQRNYGHFTSDVGLALRALQGRQNDANSRELEPGDAKCRVGFKPSVHSSTEGKKW